MSKQEKPLARLTKEEFNASLERDSFLRQKSYELMLLEKAHHTLSGEQMEKHGLDPKKNYRVNDDREVFLVEEPKEKKKEKTVKKPLKK